MYEEDARKADTGKRIEIGFNYRIEPHADSKSEREHAVYIEFGYDYSAFSLADAVWMRDRLDKIIDYYGADEPIESPYKVGDRVEVYGRGDEWDGPATVTALSNDVFAGGVSVDTDSGRHGHFNPKQIRSYIDPTTRQKIAALPVGTVFRVDTHPASQSYGVLVNRSIIGTPTKIEITPEQLDEYDFFDDYTITVLYNPEETTNAAL